MGKQGPTEKDINLRIMQYAAKELEKRGATVIVTRNNDTFYSLDARVQKIRDVKPDFTPIADRTQVVMPMSTAASQMLTLPAMAREMPTASASIEVATAIRNMVLKDRSAS